MFTSIIEFIAIVLFVGGYWHAARAEGRALAQQWFTAGYLVAIIREMLNQVLFQVYVFAPAIMRLGSAPVLVTLLSISVAYLAFAFAQRWVEPRHAKWMMLLVFLITASIALPIEATAAQLRWWYYPEATQTMFGKVPWGAPLAWGGGAAIFYAVFWRIRQTRLNERGKLYALIALAPIIAVAQLVLTILLSA